MANLIEPKDGLRVRLLADDVWCAGKVKAGAVGTLRLDVERVPAWRIDFDGIVPKDGWFFGVSYLPSDRFEVVE